MTQSVWWFERQCLADSIAHKLVGTKFAGLAESLVTCHTEVTYQRCNGCSKVTQFYNHCDVRICPICQPRLARNRREELAWWVAQVAQPKHVVLTVRNSQVFTKAYVQWFKKCFTQLRRSSFAKNWNGGMFSLEVTNESKGWHLHLHALIDAKWIDAQKLAQIWAKLVGQDFAIVKVQDCRDKQYLAEVSKYTVKGSDLAKWPASELVTYLDAMDGVRCFGTFGSLFQRNSAFLAWRDLVLRPSRTCPCGCDKFRYFSSSEYQWEIEVKGSRPPPKVEFVEPQRQAELPIGNPFQSHLHALAR